MKRLIVLTLFLITTCSVAFAETLTLTTYYPSPFGAYDRLRLVPRVVVGAGGITCDASLEGLMAYDINDDVIYICKNGTWGTLGGVWTQNTDDIYPTDTLSNANLQVGIGRINPSEKLHVDGDDADKIAVAIENSNAGVNTAEVLFQNTSSAGGGWSMGTDLNRDADDNLYIWGGSPASTHLFMNNLGYIGTGGETNPDARLDVQSTGTEDILNLSNSSSELLTVLEDGEVGIGTPNPVAHLQVESPDGLTRLRLAETTGTDAVWELRAHTNNNPNNDYKDDFSIWGGTQGNRDYRIIIDEEGDVGIGEHPDDDDPDAGLVITKTEFPVLRVIRQTTSSGQTLSSMSIKHRTSNNMGNGFGVELTFEIEDNNGVNNEIANIIARRDGSDNNGALELQPFTNGNPGSTPKLRIESNGYVAINAARDTATHHLHVNGNARKTSGGNTWATSSDERLKKNIKPLVGALDSLLQLKGVNYQWINPEDHGDATGVQMGMIAQEVEQVFPDWIDEGPDGYKFLSINGFEALAIEAIRELKSDVDSLKAENMELKKRIEKLEEFNEEVI